MRIDDFVGLPFRPLGRDRAGVDCWGLVRLVYRDCLGVDLPAFSDRYTSGADARHLSGLIDEGIAEAWHPVAAGEERAFDAVLMRQAGIPRHVGLVAGPGRVLHVEPESFSMIDSYRSVRLQRRVVGFFRHVSQ